MTSNRSSSTSRSVGTDDSTTPTKPAGRFATTFGLLSLVALFAFSTWSLQVADDLKPRDWQKDHLTYLPSGKYLKPMTLGFTEATGSLLWVKGVLYFGEAYMTNGDYHWMGHILDIVTTLNPHFHEAYNFGASLLTRNKKEIPSTLKLIDRGLEQFPHEWQWRVAAALAIKRTDSNFIAAAAYLEPLGGDTTVPKHVRLMYATFITAGGFENLAIAYLVERYYQSRTIMEREIFLDKLEKLWPDSTSKFIEKSKEEKTQILKNILELGRGREMQEVEALIGRILINGFNPRAKH